MKFHYAIMGGTFDRFHAGHQALIKAACEASDKVDIGVTTEKFYKNKVLADIIEPYKTREQAVKDYLKESGFDQKVALIQLEDIYGNGLKNKDIDALFVTSDTVENAKIINQKRKEQNFPEIEIITIPFVLSEDKKPITAERIRRGEINREGKVYANLFKADLKLPENLRQELRKPIGEIVTSLQTSLSKLKESQTSNVLISVGDIVTLDLLNTGITPALSVIDFKTQRKNIDEEELREKLNSQEQKYKNDPGSINYQTVEILQQKMNQYINTKQPQTLIIDGEEDLLTLPAILLAPLEATVIYGQVGQGAVIVKITEELKENMRRLIIKFNK